MQQTSKNTTVKDLSRIKQIPRIKEYLEETDFLKIARAKAESRKIPIVDDETGRFLELICYLLKPQKILEIGCGTGYSTYFLLKHLFPELAAAEAVAGKMNVQKMQFSYTGIDLNRERLREAYLFIGGLINKPIKPGSDGSSLKSVLEGKNICYNFEFIHGNAIKIIQSIPEKYDLVFIDAAKFEYPYYLEAVKGKLKDGCAVIADNIFYSGKIFHEEILKHDGNSVAGLKEYIGSVTGKAAFETSFFNIGDGLAFSIFKKDQ